MIRLCLLAALGLGAIPALAQRAAITGRITDAQTQAGIPDVQVRIAGTTQGTMSRTDGTFRLPAKAGPVAVQVLRLGYQAVTRTVTVPDSGTITADFALQPSSVQLDQVIVTATGASERKREEGMSVATLSLDSVPKGAVANFSDALSSRTPGVSVQLQSGTTGGGSRIRIRGSNSASLDNQPLLVIDGIRVDNSETGYSSNVFVGGQAPSRFDDLNPDEISDVTILKGPAASALYGSAGANGVIQVTTKKGRAGKTEWNAHAEYGSVRNFTSMPANYGRNGTLAAGGTTAFCTLASEADGTCTPLAGGGLFSFNPLQTFSPFVAGYRQGYGGSVTGGSDATNIFASGDYYKEQGVYSNNTAQRANVRANVHTVLSPKFDGTINLGYLAGITDLPQNDNASFGVLSGGLLGTPTFDSATLGFSSGVTPQKLSRVLTLQNTDRFTMGATGNWHPLDWFSLISTAGLDYSTVFDNVKLPAGVFPASSQLGAGQAQSDPFKNYTWTATTTGSARYSLGESLRATSSLGSQFVQTVVNSLQSSCITLAPGTSTTAGCTTNLALAFPDNTNKVQIGGFAQQQVQWRDKVFFTAAVRADEVNTFGTTVGLQFYPSVSLSWVAAEEPWFPKSDIVSSLRLRGAFGESGQSPNFRQNLTYSIARATKKLGIDGAAATDSGYGNPTLQPERTLEGEAGLDIGLFKDRVNIEATYYSKRTNQALVERVVTPETGVGVQFVNLGEVTNKGLEIGINGVLVDTRPVRADITVNAGINHNKLVKLGNGIKPITFDAGNAADTQEHTPGYPLGGFWSYHYTYKDANHDGIIQNSEIAVDNSHLIFFGNSQPSDEYSINPAVTLFRFLKVSALFDRHAGVLTYNGTEEFRCGFAFQICPSLYLKNTPLNQQAATVVSNFASQGLGNGSDAGFFEDGSFWKWRELTITVSAPQAWARKIGAGDVSFSLSGRNLHTWTKYRGFDPEINFGFASSQFTSSDFLTQPPVRYWTGRVNITW